jgi:hypothetical protein
MFSGRKRFAALAASGLVSVVLLAGCGGGLSSASSCGDFLSASPAQQVAYMDGVWKANFGNSGETDGTGPASAIFNLCTSYGSQANLGDVTSSYMGVGAAMFEGQYGG